MGGGGHALSPFGRGEIRETSQRGRHLKLVFEGMAKINSVNKNCTTWGKKKRKAAGLVGAIGRWGGQSKG